jgi:hypothetical protein
MSSRNRTGRGIESLNSGTAAKYSRTAAHVRYSRSALSCSAFRREGGIVRTAFLALSQYTGLLESRRANVTNHDPEVDRLVNGRNVGLAGGRSSSRVTAFSWPGALLRANAVPLNHRTADALRAVP